MVRVRQKLGKYRVEKRLAEGGFATVYEAMDTIEGIPVALKVPHPHLISKSALESFRKEVRITAKLDHPNILPIKNAGYVNDQFVIVYPLGTGTLGDRMRKRISLRSALRFTEQMLEAVAFAHARKIMHLDVKPDNFITFERDRVRLADFGIARVAMRTVAASGAGTVGYIAPEQAMGKPSLRSDVFSLGLIIYRMFAGVLPEWPYEWPPKGYERIKRTLHPQFIALIRRAMSVDHRERFADAGKMLAAFRKLRHRALRPSAHARARAASNGHVRTVRSWRTLRIREFQRRYRRVLEVRSTCEQCGEPVSEVMQACPWCGSKREKHRDETKFPCRCPRCKRGMKLDWRYCPWCYGGTVGPHSPRPFTDKRYVARCHNASCDRKQLMPFMRYCPWCRQKVRQSWTIPPPGSGSGRNVKGGEGTSCRRCGHGVLAEFWTYCPWCAAAIEDV